MIHHCTRKGEGILQVRARGARDFRLLGIEPDGWRLGIAGNPERGGSVTHVNPRNHGLEELRLVLVVDVDHPDDLRGV